METEELAQQLMNAFSSMSKHNVKYLTAGDTKRSVMAIITVLAAHKEENGLKITEISSKLNLPPSAITPVINSLEEGGFIIRKNSPYDRRIVLVELTEKGREFFENKHEFFFRKSVALVNYLGEEDAKEFIRLFKKASEFMHKQMDDDFDIHPKKPCDFSGDPDNNIHP